MWMHKLRVKDLIWGTDIDGSGTTYTLELIHCPQDPSCAVWHECHEDGCMLPLPWEDEWEDDREWDDDEAMSHGVCHRFIDDSWMTKDNPHNCAAQWIDEWYGIDELVHQHGAGVYSFDIDYSGEGYWTALGFEFESK